MRALLGLVVVAFMAMTATADAAPATYRLNADHTDVTFEVDHLGFSMKHGWFREMSGQLTLDQDRPEASSVSVTIGAASIDTNHAQRDTDLKGARFLDVAQFPSITFASTRVVRTATDTADVEGRLTMHGVTRPVVLHTKLNKIGANPFDQSPTVGFRATAQLRRSEFGIANLIPMIGDDVSIVIDAEFSGAAPARRN